MRIQKLFFNSILFFISMFFLMTSAFAHVMTISPLSPFPSNVNVGTTTTATYQITNITSKVPLTAIDQSQFPSELSVLNSTCGSLMQPGQSCQITLKLQAALVPNKISTYLKIWAKPSADGIRLPIIVSVVIPPTYIVTPSAGANGTITPDTPQTVTQGDSVSFTATPNTGYVVNQWLLDGNLVQTGGTSYTLSNVTANHNVQVTFAIQTFTVTPSAGANGTISPSTPQTVNYNDSVTFTATPSTGYLVNQWLLDGNLVQTGGTSYTLSNVTANHNVQVTFVIQTFTVTPFQNPNGTISPGTAQTVNYNGSVTFTATPNTGYVVNRWLVDGNQVQIGGTSYTLSNVTANHSVQATFAIQTFTVTPSQNANGTISPSTPQTVNYNGSVTFTATPNTGYVVNQWLLDGNLVQTGGTSYTLSNVTADHGVQATFTTQTFTVTPSQNANGTISPGTPQTVSYNGSVTFTATPNSGYAVNQWLLDGNAVQTGGTSYTLSNVTANHGVQATFISVSGIITAVGDSGTTPIIAASTNGGTNWSLQTITPFSGFFNSSSCTGSGSTAICTAVGAINSGAGVIAQTTDGTATWTEPTITNNPALGEYFSTSCVGTGATAICTAAGNSTSGAITAPLLAATTNGGSAWAVETITNIPANGSFNATSCTGTASTAICVAAGENLNSLPATPLIAMTTDGSNTWSTVTSITGIPSTGMFNGSSCTGSGSTAICIAVGQNTASSPNSPLLVITTDGGSTWSTQSITSSSGSFTGASCTGSGSTAICVAVGTIGVNPLLAVSTDGGSTWSIPTITGLPSGNFDGVSCQGTGSTAVCAAAGGNSTTGLPLLVQSTDGGNTWAIQTVSGATVAGGFNDISCTGVGATTKCAAVGSATSGAPYLAVTTNGGAAWATTTVPSYTTGNLFGTGATGG